MQSVEAGLRFRTRSDLVVETTGATQYIESQDVLVHEVVIVEGPGVGYKYFHNLDVAVKL